MKFQFENLQEFLSMPSYQTFHGPYVWACYLITFVALVAIALNNRHKKKKIIHSVRRAEALRAANEDQLV